VESGSRNEQWATWMRAGIAGDREAYRRFLEAVTPFVRGTAANRCSRLGISWAEVEDIVQEVLLAIHLKRGTWDQGRPIGPWIAAIVRNKVVDSFRKRGRTTVISIDGVVNTLQSAEVPVEPETSSLSRMLADLRDVQRAIVMSISVEGQSIKQTATRLQMSEGAVRVALHRALKSLAAKYRDTA
jgi:RNA polymerase sigma-70 factor (ECF subfamily)